VSYFIVPVDARDPTHPALGTPISVPGIPFGASAEDPGTLYLSNYSWDDRHNEVNQVSVCKLSGDRCVLQGSVALGGIMGLPFVHGDKAYATITDSGFSVLGALHEFDLTNPLSPVDRTVPTPSLSWGALLAVSGDAALVTSGWASGGADVYRLNGTDPPVYTQTVGSLFPSMSTLTRQGNTLYVASGGAGVETISLQ
jgi:hypothetical protein